MPDATNEDVNSVQIAGIISHVSEDPDPRTGAFEVLVRTVVRPESVMFVPCLIQTDQPQLLTAGARIEIEGHVSRRFFRTRGGTQGRTAVNVDRFQVHRKDTPMRHDDETVQVTAELLVELASYGWKAIQVDTPDNRYGTMVEDRSKVAAEYLGILLLEPDADVDGEFVREAIRDVRHNRDRVAERLRDNDSDLYQTSWLPFDPEYDGQRIADMFLNGNISDACEVIADADDPVMAMAAVHARLTPPDAARLAMAWGNRRRD